MKWSGYSLYECTFEHIPGSKQFWETPAIDDCRFEKTKDVFMRDVQQRLSQRRGFSFLIDFPLDIYSSVFKTDKE